MSTFYITTTLSNAARATELRVALEALGHKLTHDWTQHIDEKREIAMAKIRGVLYADFIVVVLPGGCDTYTELGIALAKDIPVFLIYNTNALPIDADGLTCPFYHSPMVRHFRGYRSPEELAYLIDRWVPIS